MLKFVFFRNEEMQAVADFVMKTGRVSKQDLSRQSGKLINLENL